MKTIKLFNAFGIDANRLCELRGQIMDFFLVSDKWTYDEIHIPYDFENDKDINELIKEYNLNDKVRYYDPSEKTMHELPSLKDVHNRMIFNHLIEQTKEIVEKNSKPPKLEVTHAGTNEDGVLRVVIDVKEQNDPNTFLKVIRGLNKVLREYEEDILNG